MRPVLRPFVVGAVVAVLPALLGMGTIPSLVLGAVAVVLAFAWDSMSAGLVYAWPEAQVEETDGTRREIAALTWSFVGRDGRVSETALRRLREVAVRRLAQHGLALPGGFVAVARGDLPPETVEQGRRLLGDRAWTTLSGRGGYMPPLSELTHCVERLEALGPAGTIDERQRT